MDSVQSSKDKKQWSLVASFRPDLRTAGRFLLFSFSIFLQNGQMSDVGSTVPAKVLENLRASSDGVKLRP